MPVLNVNTMTRNTTTKDSLMTPCPNCGARCYAIVDLDENGKCNDCRETEAPVVKTYPTEGTGKGYKGFKKGQSGNPAGRPKGAKTKHVGEIRRFLLMAVEKNLPRFQEDLDKMRPFQRWMILKGMMQHCMPVLVPEEDAGDGANIVIEVRYGNGLADSDINQPTAAVQVIGADNYGLSPDEDDEDYIEFKELDDEEV